MADYPADLVRERRLGDGRLVIIRPIRPQDEPGEHDFFDLLGLPLFGLLGFLGAAVAGAWLLISILRSGG
jgi:hypothetical protein